RRQQGDGGGVFGDNQFTSTLSVNFHFPRIPRRTFFYGSRPEMLIRKIRSGSRPDPRTDPRSALGKARGISKRSHPRQGIAQMRSSQDQIEISL
ncbi:hypothetical protein, partial [Aeromonas caviae]|uniref:hypothetical protein n=1 Tax=Aeromonas caviae TaxID=648 RepID=UPI001CC561E1